MSELSFVSNHSVVIDLSLLRSPGVWIALAGGGLMLANALRAFRDPSRFAAYLGLPLADEKDAGLVRVYALRALFIALTVGILLLRGEPRTLGWICLAAAVMPVGDLVLTARAGAARPTVMRHALIAMILLLASYLLLARPL